MISTWLVVLALKGMVCTSRLERGSLQPHCPRCKIKLRGTRSVDMALPKESLFILCPSFTTGAADKGLC